MTDAENAIGQAVKAWRDAQEAEFQARVSLALVVSEQLDRDAITKDRACEIAGIARTTLDRWLK